MLDSVQLEKDLAEVFSRCIKRNEPAVNRIKKAFAEAVKTSHNNAMDAIASLHQEFLREKASGAVSVGLDSMIEWCEEQRHQ